MDSPWSFQIFIWESQNIFNVNVFLTWQIIHVLRQYHYNRSVSNSSLYFAVKRKAIKSSITYAGKVICAFRPLNSRNKVCRFVFCNLKVIVPFKIRIRQAEIIFLFCNHGWLFFFQKHWSQATHIWFLLQAIAQRIHLPLTL